MKRIVFYNHTGKVSGAETMLLLTLSELSARGMDPHLICPDEGPLKSAATGLGIPVYASFSFTARFTKNPFLAAKYLFSFLVALRGLRYAILELNPDLVHANTVRAGLAATIATVGTKLPVVLHNHDMLPRHPFTTVIRTVISSARIHVVACSAAAAKTIQPLFGRQRDVKVIYNAIRLRPGRLAPSKREEIRTREGVDGNVFAVCIVGQITPRKGQLELIRSFIEVRKQIPDAVLLVIGSPMFNHDDLYQTALQEEVKQQGLTHAVRFMGFRKDAAELVGASDLLVLNSKAEPFALVIIEAMARGTPVIASDCGGPSEIIENGKNGEIFQFGDPSELAASIVRIYRDPSLRECYVRDALSRVTNTYRPEQYIDQWCNVYQEMMSNDLRPAVRPVITPLRSSHEEGVSE